MTPTPDDKLRELAVSFHTHAGYTGTPSESFVTGFIEVLKAADLVPRVELTPRVREHLGHGVALAIYDKRDEDGFCLQAILDASKEAE